MVDATRLLRLLRTVSDETAVLEAERASGGDRRQDVLWLRGVKYAFVTAIEACVDDAIVVARLDDLDDLREYVRRLSGLAS